MKAAFLIMAADSSCKLVAPAGSPERGCGFNLASNQTHSETRFTVPVDNPPGKHWMHISAIAEGGTVFLRSMRISASKFRG